VALCCGGRLLQRPLQGEDDTSQGAGTPQSKYYMDGLQRFLHLIFLLFPCTPGQSDIGKWTKHFVCLSPLGAGDRVGKGLSYRPATLHRLVGKCDNSVPTRFLVPMDCSKIPLQCLCRHKATIKKSWYPPPPKEKTGEKKKD
jgi:hypothetical protein